MIFILLIIRNLLRIAVRHRLGKLHYLHPREGPTDYDTLDKKGPPYYRLCLRGAKECPVAQSKILKDNPPPPWLVNKINNKQEEAGRDSQVMNRLRAFLSWLSQLLASCISYFYYPIENYEQDSSGERQLLVLQSTVSIR